MEIFILDELFRSLYSLDVFESLIWTERYNGCGNFEFYTLMNERILTVINKIQEKMEEGYDCYAWLKDSGNAMVIEDIEITTDVETGNHLIMSGRGLESLLERRIIWDRTSLDGDFQNGVKRLLDDAIINPKMSDRKIPKFIFSNSEDEYIKSLKLKAQYTGDNLYDTILTLCDTYQLGFNVSLDQDNNFVFKFVYGEDRSYNQEENPYVVFSPKYENIINSDYLESDKTLKNVTLVAGEGEGEQRVKVIVGGGVGQKRRELYTDARDLQSADYAEGIRENEEKLDEYKQKLEDETKEFERDTEDYNEEKASYDSSKSSHQVRITNFQTRISYYNQQITNYSNNLSQSQKSSLATRNNYKTQSDNYQSLINECSSKINEYNDKLNNEENITYAKIVEYEQGIESEESKQSGYETQKSAVDQSKSEIEKELPNYETTLSKYESMISKYQGIVENDQKDLTDETKDFNKKKTTYESKKSKYETNAAQYEIKIAEYEAAISEESIVLSEYYKSILERRGRDKLSENIYTKVFTGEIEATKTYVFNEDFFIGDLVQIVNEYSMESKVRVSEVVRVQDTNGYSMYPTFQVIE